MKVAMMTMMMTMMLMVTPTMMIDHPSYLSILLGVRLDVWYPICTCCIGYTPLQLLAASCGSSSFICSWPSTSGGESSQTPGMSTHGAWVCSWVTLDWPWDNLVTCSVHYQIHILIVSVNFSCAAFLGIFYILRSKHGTPLPWITVCSWTRDFLIQVHLLVYHI